MSGTERKVAVVIPVRNGAETIGRAVASALAQPEAAEVVLIDDGSTDATVERALGAAAGSERLHVRSLACSGGPAAARNLAIGLSSAPWICPLDADDFMRPGRLARLLDRSAGADLVADDLLVVREGEEDAEPRRVIGDREPLPITLTFQGFVESNISRPGMPRREYGFLKPLMRRAFLEAAALAYDESLRLGEDFILYASALARSARFRVVEPCGYVAVERAGSLSGRHATADLQALLAASRRMERTEALSVRDLKAVRGHQRHLQAKVHLREVLDVRRDGGLARGLLAIAARAPSAGYILSRMIEDKAAALGARRHGGGRAAKGAPTPAHS